MKKNKSTVALLLVLLFILPTFSLPLVNAVEDSWTTLEPMPTAETGLGAAVVKGKIYVVGEEVNYEYDPDADTWTPRTPMPTPRAGFGVAVYQDRIYVIGRGYGVYPNRTVTGANEVYDPATDTWETKVSMPTNRSSMCANVVDGKIYLIGGRTGEQNSTVDLNQVYDPETDTWTTKESIPYAVVGYASVVVAGKIYMIGGQAEFDPRMNIDNTQIYDPENDTWSQGTPIPTATLAAGAGATNGELAPERIYVMGGDGGFLYPLNQNYVYNPQTDVWNTGTPIPTPRINPAIAVVNDLIYVIGGTSGPGGLQSTPTATVERYTPADYIPEFPSWLFLPLFFVATLVGVVVKRKVFRPT